MGSIKADNLRRKRNRPPPDQPWIWLTRELLESEAWRTASIHVRRLIERLLVEHMAHGGTENGRLICTYADLTKAGIRRQRIPDVIRDAIQRGLI
jgi:hypothetical protein